MVGRIGMELFRVHPRLRYMRKSARQTVSVSVTLIHTLHACDKPACFTYGRAWTDCAAAMLVGTVQAIVQLCAARIALAHAHTRQWR